MEYWKLSISISLLFAKVVLNLLSYTLSTLFILEKLTESNISWSSLSSPLVMSYIVSLGYV